MKRLSFYLLLLLLPCLLGACKDDDGYEYPPVKLEFLTAESGVDGTITAVVPDKGPRLLVAEDLSGITIEANSTRRVISNYEEMAAEGGGTVARIYALAAVVAAQPELPSVFKNGIKTDPADVLSIWMGKDYLNIILNIKTQNGKHTFHFVETETGEDATTGRKYVRILLYHDAGDDVQAYTKRGYLSVPLSKYAVAGETVDVYFTLNTYSGVQKTYPFEYTK